MALAAKATTKERTSKQDGAKPNVVPSGSRRKPQVVPYAARATQFWEYQSIRAAINAQLIGDFRQICALATSLLLDSSYSAALTRRINGLIRSALTFEAYDTTEPGAKQAVDLCSRYVDQMLPESELRACLTDWHDVGLFFGRISVKAINGLLLPCLTHLNPQSLRFYQAGQTGANRGSPEDGRPEWRYTAQNGEFVVTPGDGEWVLISQWRPGYPAGFVTALGDEWADGTIAKRSWVDWCDNSGFPITKAVTPADGKAEEKTQFVSDLAVLKTSKVVECPKDKDGYGYDVEAIPSTAAEGYAGLKELVEHRRLMFQILILGGNLSSEVGPNGSYAAADVHMGIARELIASDAKAISTGLRDQLFRAAVEWNIVDQVETPSPCWDVSPPQDPKAMMDAMLGFASLAKALADAGLKADNLAEIGERLGLQLSSTTK